MSLTALLALAAFLLVDVAAVALLLALPAGDAS